MIPAFLYKYIYFLIITVLTLSEVQRLRSLNEKEGSLGSLFLCLFMVFFYRIPSCIRAFCGYG